MTALILGVLGQDGSYLAEQLLADGHEVWGMTRRPKAVSPARLVTGDLLDQDSLETVLRSCRPDVIYNLAAVTSPGGAWGTRQPPLLADVTGLGVLRLLDAMVKAAPDARLVHASSSAIYDPHRYGLYGVSKQFAHAAVVGYRDRIWCANAVLFSHTSPRQDLRFLARRICSTIARVAAGSRGHLVLGDIESRRDWGYAPDYMTATRLVAEQECPGDWVVATGVTHSVRDLTETALRLAGLEWDEVVRIDPGAPRIPDEVHPDSQDARIAAMRGLDWRPQTSFSEMVGHLLA